MCIYIYIYMCVCVCVCACACMCVRACMRGVIFARRSVFRNLTKHVQLALLGRSHSFGLGSSHANGSVIAINMSLNVR